jgi:hypothetical protein
MYMSVFIASASTNLEHCVFNCYLLRVSAVLGYHQTVHACERIPRNTDLINKHNGLTIPVYIYIYIYIYVYI